MFHLVPWRKRKTQTAQPLPTNFHQWMERFMDDSFHPLSLFEPDRIWPSDEIVWPRVDISETGDKITVEAEIAGMDKKDVDISLNGRILTLKGEKKEEREAKEKGFHHIERSFGRFLRRIELPAEVDPSDVDARYKKGVLKITMNKIRPEASSRIPVKYR